MNNKILSQIDKSLINLYNEQQLSDPENLTPNPFSEDYVALLNTEKGGMNVTENVVYGCLREVQWTIAMDAEMNDQNWECPFCNEAVPMDGIQKLIHKARCKQPKPRSTKFEDRERIDDIKRKESKSAQPGYGCPNCNKTLYLSAIDILRHKKSCKK